MTTETDLRIMIEEEERRGAARGDGKLRTQTDFRAEAERTEARERARQPRRRKAYRPLLYRDF